MRTTTAHLSALLPFLLFAVPAWAQAAGLRGAAQEAALVQRLGAPDPVAAERVIAIEGVAEVRVVPSSLRLVFAASASGATASVASAACQKLVADTKSKLTAAGVKETAIDVDFIAALPVFAWQVEEQSHKDVVAEKRTGSRVQYNLHVTVADEAAALVAIEAATAGEGVDVLAIDYWSDQLSQKQAEAQAKALAAAQQKTKLLLAVFPQPPKAVNVHESTRVLYPQQLYQSLQRAEDASNWYGRDSLPRVAAPRPLQIYYRGLFADVDAMEAAMPGKREIHVVSTVRLYFAAPDRPQTVVK